MYEHGRGVAQDFKRAMTWYAQAALRGEAGAAIKARQMQARQRLLDI